MPLHRLAAWGIIAGTRAAAGKAVAAHIADWRIAMAAKGNSAKHVKEQASKVKRLAKECKWRHPSDITASSFDKWRTRQKEAGVALQTINSYLIAVKTHCN